MKTPGKASWRKALAGKGRFIEIALLGLALQPGSFRATSVD